jgi:small-conductance mechanosensitive channel
MEQEGLSANLIRTYDAMVRSIFDAIPKVVTGIVLVIVSIIIAKLIERTARMLLRRIGFDDLLARLGFDKILKRFGVDQPLSFIFPKLVYYLLLLLFGQTAATALGMVPIAHAIGSFLGFLPNLFTALGLVLIGSSVSQYASAMVSKAAREAGIDYSTTLGSVVAALILFVVGVMAIAQLRINTDIIRIVTVCVLSGVALAFALSFGLGTRDITRNILAGFYARKVFRVGDQVEIRGHRGTLAAITPVHTVVEGEHESAVMTNGAFLDEVVKR